MTYLNVKGQGQIVIFKNHNIQYILLAHLSHKLKVSYCDRWMSVVRRALSTIASNDISP